MREIKFRALKLRTKEFIYGSLMSDDKQEVAMIQQRANPVNYGNATGWCFGVIPESIGQFTGLQDKNGVDIYEGDLAINAVGEKGIVKSEDGTFYLYYFDEPAKQYLHLSVIKDKDYNSTGKCDIEVTGNIHTTKL